MDHWPLTRWLARFALGNYIRRARRDVRAARRAHGRATLASAVSRTLSPFRSESLQYDPRSPPTHHPVIALDTPPHARMAHRRPHSHGHLHGQTLYMRHCRVRDGEPVSPRQRHRVRYRHEPVLVCALDYAPDRDGHQYPFEAVGRGGGTRPRSASDQEAGRLLGTPGYPTYLFRSVRLYLYPLLQDCFQWEYGNFTL